MPFRTALSGLNAASADLRVTGHNIANAGTTGFKQSRSEFSDVFATAYGGISQTAVGAGVRLSSVTQQFTQGNIDFTGNNLDMSLSGKGFFVLEDSGGRSYSRDGSFQIDRDGYVVNAAGKRLQSYAVQDSLSGAFNMGGLADLRLSTTESSPRASSQVEAVFNLPSGAEDVSAIPFSASDPSSFTFSTSMTLYDSLGQSHVATMFFRNTGQLTWDAHLTVDGDDVGDAQPLQFSDDGLLQSPASPFGFGAWTPPNGAGPIDVAFDFSNATQYGNHGSVTSLRQDGFASGRLSGVDISESGVAYARFTNGQSQPLGQVAVASFANPQGLQQAGDNAWLETFAAGDPVFGVAGSGDLGTVQSGGLESSNVDIAEQLVKLITAQRNFQANAQVISTADSITQTVINLR